MEPEFSIQRDDIEAHYRKVKAWARESFTYEQLLHEFAKTRIGVSLCKAKVNAYEKLKAQKTPLEKEIRRLQSELNINTYEKIAIETFNKGIQTGAEVMGNALKVEAQKRGKQAAEIRHGKPGGSRSKTDEMRSLWASGKYSSRDICAEQECGALELSFSTARKALRGTPDPT